VGFDDNNSQVYQDLLNLGNHLYPLATDDFHRMPTEHFIAGGWVMVGAEKLDYPSVIHALEAGDFYASTGPEIHSLTLEGTVLRFTCAPCQHVMVFSQSRHAAQVANEDHTPVTSGEVDIAPWLQCWEEYGRQEEAFLRLVFTDPAGNRAYTRAYWYKELV
jgi:hypothetical protein